MSDANNLHTQFSAAIDYLYGFINFEKRRQDRYMAAKLDSTRPARLMATLDDPHKAYPSIHIAGTKGKGSVAAMCAFALRAAGYKVGLYTSPHLQDFRERIRVLSPADPDGLIPEASFIRIMERIKQVAGQFPDITWFEILTAVAFLYFAEAEVDVAVVEVGLGGRLDATNVLTPLVSVITSLSLDHTRFLGNTLSEIAFEKGGIIKPGVPVVIAPQKAEATEQTACARCGAGCAADRHRRRLAVPAYRRQPA
jgi:dihydrofolate synthase/folylpolyglutamate synthase